MKRKLAEVGDMESEEQLAVFFNQICCDIEEITEEKAIRTWNSSFCSTVLEGSPISQKPDIILVDEPHCVVFRSSYHRSNYPRI